MHPVLAYLGFFSPTRVGRVSDLLLLTQEVDANGPNLLTSLARFFPVEFARATNGYVYMTNGLRKPTKWNGIRRDVLTVGMDAPTTAVTMAVDAEATGSINGIYRAYVRYYDAEGNVSNLSPVSEQLEIIDGTTITYTNIPVPTDPKVIGRQILRNTAGQFLVFYVDVDSEDLTDTSYDSTRLDAVLRNQTPVPLFDDAFQQDLANRHGRPPTDKPFITYYQNRLFAYGEVIYDEGHIQVTFGSRTVTGVGTEWTEEMAERKLHVSASRRQYTIESVNITAQTLTLAEDYIGATDLFAEYKIRPTPERRQQLAYSESGRFDAWGDNQSLIVASSDDIDDDPAGLVSTQSFLFMLQRRHIYRLTFLADPARDGGIFLAARRGCVNNRCWVNVDGFTYCLDDRGIYKFDGSDNTEDISQAIQDIFYFDREASEIRVNWRASKFFHAAHDRHDATIRWFVSLTGNYLPRHAICFNYSTPQWWIEEYPFAIGDSSTLKADGALPIVAGPNRRVLGMQVGTLDVTDAKDGDTRGVPSAVTMMGLTAPTTMILPVAGVVGAPIGIVAGRGKGQWRIITAVSSNVITIDRPWQVLPAAEGEDDEDGLVIESTFQIGGFPWKWKSGWTEWPVQERNQARKIAVGFQPTDDFGQIDLRLYADYATVPTNSATTFPRLAAESIGVKTIKGEPDAEINTQQPRGYAQLTIDAYQMYDADTEDIVSVELAGFAGPSPVTVYQIGLYGASER